MVFYAHSKESGEYQLLKDHLQGVADLTRKYAEVFGAGGLGYLAGLMHDVGKYSVEFQKRIQGSNIKVDHSTAGAQWVVQEKVFLEHIGTSLLAKYLARIVAFIIAGHHVGLSNYGTADDNSSLMYRLLKPMNEVPDWSSAWLELSVQRECRSDIPILHRQKLTNENLAWKYSFLGRMLYSCLVDADSIDTRDFCKVEDQLLMNKKNTPTMASLLERLHEYLHHEFGGVEDTSVNRMRQQILESCKLKAYFKQDVFTLSVPTGGGKTLSSLLFALHHACEFNLRRIIYVIPFTSIIDQTADIFRNALGNEAVLEHHSNFDEQEYQENYGPDEARIQKLCAENWDAPIVVTTSVQFFESLFSNKRSRCRKLHHIARSVIIIDEAQSIPRGYMTPSLRALEELVHSYGCTAVLCTATQPTWNSLGVRSTEIIHNQSPEQLIEAFKRVEITVYGSEEEIIPDTTIVDWVRQSRQVLCIVNTRKHAKVLFDLLEEERLEGVFHLSGQMCAKHRLATLKKIEERLNTNQSCRVISTQLIEAGVDVDFPIVVRAMAGLDSIVQAAGRCNREGKPTLGEVRVFYPEKHGMPSKGWMKETAIEAQHVLKYVNADPLSSQALQHYFDRIYGISDGSVERTTDSKAIMQLIKSKNRNLEIPYEDIADRFKFIENEMQSIVILYDDNAHDLIRKLNDKGYQADVMRQLQPYSVKIYDNELIEWEREELLASAGGVMYLRDNAYYDLSLGLLPPIERLKEKHT